MKRDARSWLAAVHMMVMVAACGGGGGTPCERGESSCLCGALADEPEDVTCEASDYGEDGFCCQGEENCQCAVARCVDDPIGACICGVTWRQDAAATPVASCSAPAGGICCLDSLSEGGGGSCLCGPFASCASFEVQVGSCSILDVTSCGVNGTSVASCSD